MYICTLIRTGTHWTQFQFHTTILITIRPQHCFCIFMRAKMLRLPYNVPVAVIQFTDRLKLWPRSTSGKPHALNHALMLMMMPLSLSQQPALSPLKCLFLIQRGMQRFMNFAWFHFTDVMAPSRENERSYSYGQSKCIAQTNRSIVNCPTRKERNRSVFKLLNKAMESSIVTCCILRVSKSFLNFVNMTCSKHAVRIQAFSLPAKPV